MERIRQQATRRKLLIDIRASQDILKVVLNEAPYRKIHSAIFTLTDFFRLPPRGNKRVPEAALGNSQSWKDLIRLQNVYEAFLLEVDHGKHRSLLLRSWSSPCLMNSDLERIDLIVRDRVGATIKGLDAIVEELGNFGRDLRDPAWEEKLAISLQSCSAATLGGIIRSLLQATSIARSEAIVPEIHVTELRRFEGRIGAARLSFAEFFAPLFGSIKPQPGRGGSRGIREGMWEKAPDSPIVEKGVVYSTSALTSNKEDGTVTGLMGPINGGHAALGGVDLVEIHAVEQTERGASISDDETVLGEEDSPRSCESLEYRKPTTDSVLSMGILGAVELANCSPESGLPTLTSSKLKTRGGSSGDHKPRKAVHSHPRFKAIKKSSALKRRSINLQ